MANKGLQEDAYQALQVLQAMRDGAESATPAVLDVSSSGDSELVAAQTGKKIRLLKLTLSAAGDVTVTLKSGSTAIFGPVFLDTKGAGIQMPFDGHPICETAAGEALNINLDGAVQVGGGFSYRAV